MLLSSNRAARTFSLILLILSAAALPGRAVDTFVSTGDMVTAIASHSATLLENGRVLVTGGQASAGGGIISIPRHTQLYNPATGSWGATGIPVAARYGHTATLLPDGRVLSVGGRNLDSYHASAELYNPATGTWSATGSLGATRALHCAVLLPDGRVLVMGGENSVSAPVATAQLYDPASGVWTTTGSLTHARRGHTATLLINGKVLVAGGLGGVNATVTELYDPATALWSIGGALVAGHSQHTATSLPGGKVLIAGGVSTASPEIYDESTGAWTTTATLGGSRVFHASVLLRSGKVMVAGGTISSGDTARTEIYDPATGEWSATGPLSDIRNSHTITLLADGRVLAAGGFRRNPTNQNASVTIAQIYEPAGVSTVGNPVAVNITGNSARLGGDVTSDGGQPVTGRGIVFAVASANANPELGGAGVTSIAASSTGTTGVFTVDISGLLPATTYVFKAWATNSLGTGYSGPGSFTTLNGIEQWRLTWYGNAANSGNGADTASPYGTGIPNLAVYAFLGTGQNPALARIGQLPQPVADAGEISYQFTPPADAGGITYGAEFSSSLASGSWTPIADSGTAPGHRFLLPVTPGTKSFLRLKVSRL